MNIAPSLLQSRNAEPDGSRLAPVAILGADSPIGLTMIRELGEHRVPILALGRSPQSISRYSRYTSQFALVGDHLEDWLPGFLSERNVSAVMAVSERDLLQLARLKTALCATEIICPDSDRLEIVLDKEKTLAIAARLGISVPQSWRPCTGENFQAKAAELVYPVAIKWPDPPAVMARLQDHGLKLEKVEYAEGPDRLRTILDRYAALNEWPLVQTWCPGYGLGQMLNMHRGNATLRFQHRRLREWPSTGGVSTFCEAVSLDQHEEQMALSEKLLGKIGWEGPAMVEYRYDPRSGHYWLMEVNGRFWGSIPLAHHAGAHFAWEYYRCQTRPTVECTRPTFKECRARYVIPDTKHFLEVLCDGQKSLWHRLRFAVRFFADFLDPRVRYYVWSFYDPLPFFADMAGIIRKLLQLDRAGKAV